MQNIYHGLNELAKQAKEKSPPEFVSIEEVWTAFPQNFLDTKDLKQ